MRKHPSPSARAGFFASLALAAALAGPQSAPPGRNDAEVVARETAPSFQVRTNLVLVPVVVRNAQGQPVPNLSREDFTLFDNGKPQPITRFLVETSGARTPPERAPAQAAATPAEAPERYIAYAFDDFNLSLEDIERARQAIERQLPSDLGGPDRAAVFAISGHPVLEFTGDGQKLKAALAEVRPHPAPGAGSGSCPDLTYYEADLIANRRDESALDTATLETVVCANLDVRDPKLALPSLQLGQRMALAEAQRRVTVGENATRAALAAFRAVVRRMAASPGQRIVVLVSPGFLTLNARQPLADIIDSAVRANVIVHALDPRGLFLTEPHTQADNRGMTADPKLLAPLGRTYVDLSRMGKTSMLRNADLSNGETLASLSDGTGGTFFHNSNDLEAGFKHAAEAPAYRYVLGFTPRSLETDGSFHALKVTLKNGRGATIQARRGYFAPDKAVDPAEIARREIEDALFSRDPIRGIPVEVATRFFKPSHDSARLSVVARIDVKALPYRKEGLRNRDDLTAVAAVFDHDGNYLDGKQQILEMRLSDQTLASEQGPPVVIRFDFQMPPGAYLIRVVVQDREGERMAAENSVVEIPW